VAVIVCLSGRSLLLMRVRTGDGRRSGGCLRSTAAGGLGLVQVARGCFGPPGGDVLLREEWWSGAWGWWLV